VRWYYDVWTLLPGTQRGLWGRGVIALNEAGHRRLAGLPPFQAAGASRNQARDPRGPRDRRAPPARRPGPHPHTR
jgi:hypothetical protein